MVAFPFLDRVEISSLKILDERQSENRFVVDLLDDGGYLFPAKLCGRTQTTLTGNELESILPWPTSYSYRLQKSVRLEAFLELGKLFSVELLSRLIRVPTDLADGYGL
jgi:hypothetical protein